MVYISRLEIRTALKSFVLALGLGAAKNGTQPPHLAPGSMRGRLISLKRGILLNPALPSPLISI